MNRQKRNRARVLNARRYAHRVRNVALMQGYSAPWHLASDYTSDANLSISVSGNGTVWELVPSPIWPTKLDVEWIDPL